MKSAENRDWLVILALTLTIVGIFYRFASLDNKVFWHDEVYTSLFLSGTPNHLIQSELITRQSRAPHQLQFYQHLHDDKTVFDVVRSLLAFDPHHPPLYYVALWALAKTFGDSTWHLRAFSAFCGVLVLPAWFWLCRELFCSRRAAFVSLLFGCGFIFGNSCFFTSRLVNLRCDAFVRFVHGPAFRFCRRSAPFVDVFFDLAHVRTKRTQLPKVNIEYSMLARLKLHVQMSKKLRAALLWR